MERGPNSKHNLRLILVLSWIRPRVCTRTFQPSAYKMEPA